MNPTCHTLIVKFDRCPVPATDSIKTFIQEKLKSSKSEIEYFGCELDSGWDYVDEHLQTHLLSNCFITLIFEDEDAPKYDSDRKEILDYMINLFASNDSKIEIDEQRKDIEVTIQ